MILPPLCALSYAGLLRLRAGGRNDGDAIGDGDANDDGDAIGSLLNRRLGGVPPFVTPSPPQNSI
jgi:hypothetical protein